MNSLYSFNLPPEEQVLLRNRTITTYYAQLYLNEPQLYKWAGMAAFASFHIGEKLKVWDWEDSPIKSFSDTCQKKNKSLEDDFQVIRVINNRIFTEIGAMHLAFSQLEYSVFKSELLQTNKHKLIINAFDTLNKARNSLKNGISTNKIDKLIWQANIDILWHEQYKVVQPLFDRLSYVFSGVMSFIASFDYRVNHKRTNWQLASRFITFMLSKGLRIMLKSNFIPNVTNLEQRWYWISKDLLKKWQKAENDRTLVAEELRILSQLEERTLFLTKKKS
jgi:hypothetical protein